jgi:hypothetical protein
VIIAAPSRPDHDVDYLYGQVPLNDSFIDWSGNCGNLSSAVGPFAISNGFIDPARIPHDGICTVRIWQANIGKTIGSGLRQAAANERLEAARRLDGLPPALREMARWRVANPELNLAELAGRMKLSKSAVNHRLRRLQEVASAAERASTGKPARRSA